jgi:biopolymer transport protein ExbB
MQTLFEKYVQNGGILMFVLVPCSMLMLASILQGMIVLRRGRVLPRRILRQAQQLRDPDARRQFLFALRDQHSPLARVIWLTMKDFTERRQRPDRELLRARLDDAIILIGDKMSETVGVLSTIYTVGPLLGLIGTILGLMDTFHSYGALAQPSVQMLSVGVQKALVTTFWGLSMAIPAFVAGQWMQTRIRAYERDGLPESAWRIIDLLDGPFDQEPAALAEESAAARPAGPVLEMESEA